MRRDASRQKADDHGATQLRSVGSVSQHPSRCLRLGIDVGVRRKGEAMMNSCQYTTPVACKDQQENHETRVGEYGKKILCRLAKGSRSAPAFERRGSLKNKGTAKEHEEDA